MHEIFSTFYIGQKTVLAVDWVVLSWSGYKVQSFAFWSADERLFYKRVFDEVLLCGKSKQRLDCLIDQIVAANKASVSLINTLRAPFAKACEYSRLSSLPRNGP